MRVGRRDMIGGSLALGAAAAFPHRLAAAPGSAALPPAITPAERLGRLAKARALMARHGLGAILIEPGASLDYFTGVRWSRSERLTAALIPAVGEPIIVTPFFEKPSVAESLAIPAEIRTWDEHEEPLRLVADWLRERRLTTAPLGIEESNRFFIVDRL
ncbi:MAG: aminopeptidase P family N-terminal domain-containing protein, partial [Pseudomonadota bacterium]|nr:aminopeptidase P family N-terminal domain-containing protein [Pseudomonadota bacterium]